MLVHTLVPCCSMAWMNAKVAAPVDVPPADKQPELRV
jgi:hypothetical protein